MFNSIYLKFLAVAGVIFAALRLIAIGRKQERKNQVIKQQEEQLKTHEKITEAEDNLPRTRDAARKWLFKHRDD